MCRERHPRASRSQFILVDETTESVGSSQLRALREASVGWRHGGHGERRGLVKRPVWSMGVVMIDVLGENGFELTRWKIRIRSRHSRRMVPTKRSAKALARGARTGVRMMRILSVRKTSSKLAVNLASRSRTRNRTATSPLGEHHGQVAGLLDHPLSGGIGGDPAHVDPSGVELNEEEHVEATQQHRIDGEEVAGQHR